MLDKRLLNFMVIFVISVVSFWWTFFIYHMKFELPLVLAVIAIRMLSSRFIFNDYSLSWSKSSQKTFLIKSLVYMVSFCIYLPIFYGEVRFSFLVTELFVYLFMINFSVYGYYFVLNKSHVKKDKKVIIYGAGKAGIKLESEFIHSQYRVKCFVDDEKILQNRSIDGIKILSRDKLLSKLENSTYDMLVIAMPSASKRSISEIYNQFKDNFREIKVLPSMENILNNQEFSTQLKDISVEDLLARHPQDLDKDKIIKFITNKVILISGAGGSIGSEIVRQCKKFGAKKLILLDHSEYNLYAIAEEIKGVDIELVMQSVVDKESLDATFAKYKPQIVIHAAAYKHVPLVEANISEGISNNVIGTKNIIDISIKHDVEKFVMISTDKAVRPTNVMGTTKRICELYAQNVVPKNTEIVAVRFGNVLGSSGSVIPKFKAQIENGQNITVTHPDITRYFMLIPEACELVLQAGAIGTGGEIFILDMGEPIKIVDLAQKMIELSGKQNIEIEFSGLRAGEKLYEELLINDSDASTQYKSITVASPTKYDIEKLNKDISELLTSKEQLSKLKEIVPEFNHQTNS